MHEVKENYLVVKSNTLISARYSLDTTEARIVLSMLALIQPHDDDFCEYELSVKNIIELSQTSHKDEYARTKEALHSLLSRVIHVPKEDGYLLTHWVSSARYIEKKGLIKLKFDPDLKPYLLGLKQHFTQYPLRYVLPLSSHSTIRLYELLKMELKGKKSGVVTQNIEQLRSLLGLEKSEKYKNYKDFRIRILESAQKNCEKHTDIGFTFEGVREGRAVSKIIFNIYEVKQYARMLGEPLDLESEEKPAIEETFVQNALEPFPSPTDPQYEQKFFLLKNHGITSSTASRLANDKDLESINDAIAKLGDMEKKGEIKQSKTGLLIKLIEEEASLYSEIEKEKRRRAQEHREKEDQKAYEESVFQEANKAWIEYRHDNPEIIEKWIDEATETDYQEYFDHYKDSIHKIPRLPSGELDRIQCKKDTMFRITILSKQKRQETFTKEYIAKNLGKGVATVNGKYSLVDLA